MSDLPTDLDPNHSSASRESSITIGASDFIADAISGIPAPIRKNAFKAFAQLCTAIVDVPIAHLEGLAAEKRAETKARVALIGESGKQISEQISVSESFIDAASQKFSQKIVREQRNVQTISKIAADELKCLPEPEVTASANDDVTEDWLNLFEREASAKSSEEMQFLFGKILAGEIRKPSSFSIRTVRLLGQLDANVAKVFANFCSLVISLKNGDKVVDARVFTLGKGNEADPLKDWGISYSSLLLLQEFGLIVAELKTKMNYSYTISKGGKQAYPFEFQGKKWVLDQTAEANANQELWLSGPSLSSVGKELMAIVDVIPNANYAGALHGFFHSRNLKMKVVS